MVSHRLGRWPGSALALALLLLMTGVSGGQGDKEAAIDVFSVLTRRELFRPRDLPPQHRFLSSGDPKQFESLGHRFLGPEITKVEELPWT